MTAAWCATVAVALVAARCRPRVGSTRPWPPFATTRPHAPNPTALATSMLDTMAAEVRAGSSLPLAYEKARQQHPSTDAPFATCRTLTDVRRAHSAHPDTSFALHAIAAAAELGGPVAPTLQSAADVLRERAALRAEVSVHAAQARLSARVLTCVPLVFAAWSAIASHSFRRAMGSPAGVLSAALGLVLNLAGWVAMRRIVRGVGP